MSFVKEVGLIIDLHQSPVQEESVLRQAVNDLYIPLIRLIKSKRDMKITLSVPLSLLELLDKYGFTSQISELKDLYTAEKIDLVGSSAYGALLDNLPNSVIENQVILNEYALGYYFGALQGFEGEPSIMIKDLQGFVPSQLYINDQILKLIGGLGYRWVLTSNCCLPEKYQKPEFCVYRMVDSEVGVVKLDEETTEMLNYSGSASITELKKKISDKLGNGWKTNLLYVRCFDADSDVGYYKRKFELIDVLVDALEESGTSVLSVTDLIKVSDVVEMDAGEILKYQEANIQKKESVLERYFNSNNDKLTTLKDIEQVFANIEMTIEEKDDLHDLFTTPIWKEDLLCKISDNNLHQYVCHFILLSRFISFDKYLYLNHYLDAEDRKEAQLSQVHSFTQLLTRGLNSIPSNSEVAELLSRIDSFSSSL